MNIYKLFFKNLFVIALWADDDDDLLNIDDILSDDPSGDDDNPGGDKSPDDPSQKPGDKGGTVTSEEFKNLQELNRQQAEDVKELKSQLGKSSETIKKLSSVFTSEEDKLKAEEVAERKKWEADTPNKVKELLDERDKKLEGLIDKGNQEQKLDRIYKDIERVFDVDFDHVPSDVLQQIDLFDVEARKKNPKKVILSAYKACGKLKRRDTDEPTFIEGGGSYRNTKKGKSEAEKYKESIFAAKKNKKGGNVFGL